MWFIREVNVWGLADDAQFFYLGAESADSLPRLMFGVSTIGGASQNISFSELTDFRGNSLPPTINSPRIIARSRSAFPVFIVGEESDNGFRIARDKEAPGAVSADLFIIELG
jgi:hypothetical protein